MFTCNAPRMVCPAYKGANAPSLSGIGVATLASPHQEGQHPHGRGLDSHSRALTKCSAIDFSLVFILRVKKLSRLQSFSFISAQNFNCNLMHHLPFETHF